MSRPMEDSSGSRDLDLTAGDRCSLNFRLGGYDSHRFYIGRGSKGRDFWTWRVSAILGRHKADAPLMPFTVPHDIHEDLSMPKLLAACCYDIANEFRSQMGMPKLLAPSPVGPEPAP